MPAASTSSAYSEPDLDSQIMVEEITINVTGTPVDNEPTKPPVRVSGALFNATTQTDAMAPLNNQPFSVHKYRNSSRGIHFYTGLEDYDKFVFVLGTLGPAAYRLHYSRGVSVDTISVEDQFFLMLIKLRQHKGNWELGELFNVSESTVANVFITWVNFCYHQWSEISIWPPADIVHFFAPSDFKRKFPTTRVVVDGTEIPVKRPSAPRSQQSTFSTYKNRNTAKVLVGATPSGLVSFVTSCYGGSASDRQIVERSSLVNMCDPGDSVMADKGFDVQDLFEHRDVTINMPTFFRKKNRMTGGKVLRDRKISSKRVHIERIIGLAKTYKILKNPLNTTETLLAEEIIFTCFMLCNFRNRIVSEDA